MVTESRSYRSAPTRQDGGRIRQQGLALVAVLMAASLLAALAVSLSFAARLEVTAVRNQLDAAQARHLAEGALQLGMHDLLAVPAVRRWRTDGQRQTLSTTAGALELWIEDETGRIDLNQAPAALLDGLLREAGVTATERAALVATILAWRRPARPQRPSNGHLPGPFQRVDELGLVPGMTAALLRHVAPALTVHGAARINPAAASRQVLLAVPGLDAASIDRWIDARSQPGAVPPRWPARYFGPPVAGRTYRVTARAHVGVASATVATTVRLGGEMHPITVLDWRPVPAGDRSSAAARW